MSETFERLVLVLRLGLRRHGEVGATAVEYALIAAFIAALVGTSVAALGSKVLIMFQMGVALFP